jgi:NADP-dependent 3-hydroxy acid dehydrogenase YdfG
MGVVYKTVRGLSLTVEMGAVWRRGYPSRVLEAEDIAAPVMYALSQPDHVAVNEVLVEPRDEPV